MPWQVEVGGNWFMDLLSYDIAVVGREPLRCCLTCLANVLDFRAQFTGYTVYDISVRTFNHTLDLKLILRVGAFMTCAVG